MNKWLASIRSLAEAEALLSLSPDILDMKDPAKGALGALTSAKVREIVAMVAGRCQTSATIGDLPMISAVISNALIDMVASDVNYVKIGLFPDDHLRRCINELAETIITLKKPVIAVIFADKPLNISYIPLLATSGFHGVMVDTAVKKGQHLLKFYDVPTLTELIATAHQHQLICGLAGALQANDIKTLAPLGADYLGFRSALCHQNKRTATLNLTKAQYIARRMAVI